MDELIGFKTRSEIALELNISQKTLYRKLRDLNITLPYKRHLSPDEYEVIYKKFTLSGARLTKRD